MPSNLVQIASMPPDSTAQQLYLRATAYHSRDQTLPQLYALLRRCGGFLLGEGSTVESGQSCLKFEVPRRNVFELYSGLLSAELDLSHDSHLHLTGLCTLRRYHPFRIGNVSIQLEIGFPDEIDPEEPWAANACA